MKNKPQHRVAAAVTSLSLITAGSVHAAFIIATDGSRGAGNYTYTGAGGTAASTSIASAGNLPATIDTPATFFTLNHIFGGNGTSDEYTFTYSPGSDADNTTFAAGSNFNLPQSLTSTGLAGGGAGTYNIFRLHPANPGVSGGNTTYRGSVNGSLKMTVTIDQNAANFTTGENVGRWELIGSVDLLSASDTVTVTMTPDSSTYVSMRASGIMFEYSSPIPEPASGVLLGLGTMALLGRRRR